MLEMVLLTRLVAELSGVEIPLHCPIMGRHAFQHESGIHVQALLREDLATYEPFPPEWLGAQHEVAFGKHSGRSNIRYLCRRFSIPLPTEYEQDILNQVKEARQRLGRNPSRGDVLEMILEKMQQRAGSQEGITA
jgi:methanogen homocitrate synthase